MYKEGGHLHRLLEPVVSGLGYELVGVERIAGKRSSTVRVYIDRDGGISLNDCERVSRQISGVLDVEDPIRGHYVLEVSSPGVDRLLFTREHFARYTGQRVRMVLAHLVEGRRKFVGKLLGVAGDEVLIGEEGHEYRVPFDAIEKTRLIPDEL